MTPRDALADAWASMDGLDSEYRAGIGKRIHEQPGGYYAGYQAEASELIDRLRGRGFDVVPMGTAGR